MKWRRKMLICTTSLPHSLPLRAFHRRKPDTCGTGSCEILLSVLFWEWRPGYSTCFVIICSVRDRYAFKSPVLLGYVLCIHLSRRPLETRNAPAAPPALIVCLNSSFLHHASCFKGFVLLLVAGCCWVTREGRKLLEKGHSAPKETVSPGMLLGRSPVVRLLSLEPGRHSWPHWVALGLLIQFCLWCKTCG